MADEQRVAEAVAAREARRRRNAEQRSRWRAKRREKARAARADAPPPAPPTREHGPGRPKTRQGVVVSAKPDKTITVRIAITRRHPTYEKVVRNTNTIHVHDEANQAQEGDTVRVIESRPLSKTKRWRLVEVLERPR